MTRLFNVDGHTYEVKTYYAGMTAYSVKEDGKELYFGYSVDEIIERLGFNPDKD